MAEPNPSTEPAERYEIDVAPRVRALPHWGGGGKRLPAPEQESWAALFTAWGATLIVGSHAHVIQPARCEAGTATYFGFGNHLFDEVGPSKSPVPMFKGVGKE